MTRAGPALRPLLVLLAALLLAGCGSSAAGASPSRLPSAEPLRGNGATLPLPSDAPAEVRSLPAVFDCGAETLSDDEEQAAPSGGTSEAPGEPSDVGVSCLIRAFDAHRPAEFVVSTGSEPGDRYTIYRVGPDGSVEMYIRSAASPASPVGWDRLACHGLSDTDEGITPDGCADPVPVR